MSSIERYGSPGRGVSRQTRQALAGIDNYTAVTIAEIDAASEVFATKIDAQTSVTQRGLQGAAFLSNVEGVLGDLTPIAAARLNLLGNTGAMALAQLVSDSAAVLRRI